MALIRPQSWERHGLKPWIEAAKKRLHHNVLAIALANKLARIAWAVLNRGGNFEYAKTNAMTPQPALAWHRARGRQGVAWKRRRQNQGKGDGQP